MGLDAWLTIGVLAAILSLLATTNLPSDLAMFGGLTLLMVIGIVTPKEALAGMAEPAVLTVASLFIVAAGIRETGALHLVTDKFFGRPTSVLKAQLRMMLPVASLSAFMNNTP